MSNKPLVTIITSVYNAEKTVEKCVLSVIAQTYRNFEYFIIDGKSSDKTINILNKYSSHIDILISEKDKGIYDAWNKGVKLAKGEWVCFLGADDEFYPEALDKMVNVAMMSSVPLDYISGRTNLFKNGKLLKVAGQPYEWRVFRKYVSTGHNGALHNRSLYTSYGLYDESYKSAADYELLLRIGKNLKAGYTPYITTKMNLGGASNTSYRPILEAHRAISMHSDLSKFQLSLNTLKAILIYYIKKLR